MRTKKLMNRYNFKKFFYREIKKIASHKMWLFSLSLYPLLILTMLILLFNQGKLTELSVAVVDQNNTSLSHQLIQTVDALPEIAITEQFYDLSSAKQALLSGKVHAVMFVPKKNTQPIVTGTSPTEVVIFYNAQFMAMGTAIKSSIYNILTHFDEIKTASKSEPMVIPQVQAISVDAHINVNPSLNYLYSLLVTLFPAVLQILLVISATASFSSEKSLNYIISSASSVRAVLFGKLMPYLISYLIITAIFYGVLFGYLNMPFKGNFSLLMLGTFLFISSSLLYGVLFAIATKSVYQAFIIGSIFTVPAFEFTGTTFSINAMNTFSIVWGSFIPVVWFVQILTDQSSNGTLFSNIYRPFSFLLLICSILLILVLFLLKSIAKSRAQEKHTVLKLKITIQTDKVSARNEA